MYDVSIIGYTPYVSIESEFVPILIEVFSSLAIALCPYILMWFGIKLVIKVVAGAAQGGDINV